MPYDAAIIASVKAAFRGQQHDASPAVNNKRLFNEKLPSIRVKNVDPQLNDDIEGAMKALLLLTGGEANRFDVPVRHDTQSSGLVGLLANYARRMAPGLSSRIFNSRFMPVWLWRYIKMTQWGTKQ